MGLHCRGGQLVEGFFLRGGVVRADTGVACLRSLAQAAAGADVELPLRLRDLLEVPEGPGWGKTRCRLSKRGGTKPQWTSLWSSSTCCG